MTAEDCLKILHKVKDVAFATVDEKGRPQVRIIDVMLVENGRLYFCTARGKDFYYQLLANDQLAITGMNKKFQMVRLSGRAKRVDEQKKWIDIIFEENPVMNSVYPGESRYILEPFCIDNAELEFFDLGQEPIYRESFAIGTAQIHDKGFFITESCVECEKCKQVCPQKCIEKSGQFVIKQCHCLHCGLCFENCPTEAIKRRGE